MRIGGSQRNIGRSPVAKYSNGIKVRINSVLNNETMDKNNQFIKILEKEGLVDNPYVQINFNLEWDFSKLLGIYEESEASLNILLDNIEKVIINTEKYNNITVNSFPDLSALINILRGNINIGSAFSTKLCEHRKGLGFTFAPDGYVYWCSDMCGDYGNIGEFRKKIRIDYDQITKIDNFNIFLNETCSKCIYRFMCAGGCPIRHGLMGEIGVCGAYSNNIIMDNIHKLI